MTVSIFPFQTGHGQRVVVKEGLAAIRAILLWVCWPALRGRYGIDNKKFASVEGNFHNNSRRQLGIREIFWQLWYSFWTPKWVYVQSYLQVVAWWWEWMQMFGKVAWLLVHVCSKYTEHHVAQYYIITQNLGSNTIKEFCSAVWERFWSSQTKRVGRNISFSGSTVETNSFLRYEGMGWKSLEKKQEQIFAFNKKRCQGIWVGLTMHRKPEVTDHQRHSYPYAIWRV